MHNVVVTSCLNTGDMQSTSSKNERTFNACIQNTECFLNSGTYVDAQIGCGSYLV